MSLKVSVESRQYVKVPVNATKNGAAYDPTSDTVQVAFTAPTTDPADGDWVDGDWETIGGSYYARVLIGPGGNKTLTVDRYSVWVKITDNPEIPVLKAGSLQIF